MGDSMQTGNNRDIDHHITTMLNDILAPTNDAELKGVLKTIDVLTDYVELENVRRILKDDVLYRENRDIALMAFDILRKMHRQYPNQQYRESTVPGEMNGTPECMETETSVDLKGMSNMVEETETVGDAGSSEDDNSHPPQIMDDEELPPDFELKAPEISTVIKLPDSNPEPEPESEPEPLQPVPELPDSSDSLDALTDEEPDWDTTINRIKELKDVYVNK